MHLPTTPMLKKSHFADSYGLKLQDCGLQFDSCVNPEDRRDYVAFSLMRDAEAERLDVRCVKRGPTSVVVNPSWLPASALVRWMEARGIEGEPIDISHGMPEQYDSRWSLSDEHLYGLGLGEDDEDGGYTGEGQNVVLVAFDARARPVGFSVVEYSVVRDCLSKCAELYVSAKLTYVTPEARGKGYGVDLAVGQGFVASGLLTAVHAAARKGWVVGGHVYADLESVGGERFVRHLVSMLEYETELLSGDRARVGVELGRVQIEAGY